MRRSIIALVMLAAFCGNVFGETIVYVCNTGSFIDWLKTSLSIDGSHIVDSNPTVGSLYTNPAGIDGTARKILEDFASVVARPENAANDFVIAGHSQGGLVARRLLQLASRDPRFTGKIKGYIESMTPNYGSRMADPKWIHPTLAVAGLVYIPILVKNLIFSSWLGLATTAFYAPIVASGSKSTVRPADSIFFTRSRMGDILSASGSGDAAALFRPLMRDMTRDEARSGALERAVSEAGEDFASSLVDLAFQSDTGERGGFFNVFNPGYDSIDDMIPGSAFLDDLNGASSIEIEKLYRRASIMSNDDDIFDTGSVWKVAQPLLVLSAAQLAYWSVVAALSWWNPVVFPIAMSMVTYHSINLAAIWSLRPAARFLSGGEFFNSGKTDIIVPYCDYWNGRQLTQGLTGSSGSDYQQLIPRMSHIDGALSIPALTSSKGCNGSKSASAAKLSYHLRTAFVTVCKGTAR